MALIKCPECGKEISDKADSCPNCGYPIPHFTEVETRIKSKAYKESKNRWFMTIALDKNGTAEMHQHQAYFKPGISVMLESESKEIIGEFKAFAAAIMDGWRSTIFISFDNFENAGFEKAEYAVFRIPRDDRAFHCPKCGSANIAKIGVAHKAASAWALGVLSAKTLTSQYQCLKCGHKF